MRRSLNFEVLFDICVLGVLGCSEIGFDRGTCEEGVEGMNV